MAEEQLLGVVVALGVVVRRGRWCLGTRATATAGTSVDGGEPPQMFAERNTVTVRVR